MALRTGANMTASTPTLQFERWPYRQPFVISRGTLVEQYIGYASAPFGSRLCQGEGELHESDPHVATALVAETLKRYGALGSCPTRQDLRKALPADGARNALDAMLWDRDCKATGRRAWELAGLDGVDAATTVPTMTTLVIGEPDDMAASASALPADWATPEDMVIKVKLGGEGGVDRDIERLHAVAAALPAATLTVDPNEGWTLDELKRFLQATRTLPLALIEQPLPAGQEDLYPGLHCPVPIAADEACTTLASLDRLAGKVQVVNLKLDKCGGLTEALLMCRHARALGLQLMVGCNCGTSLAMAPAFLVATQCKFVDLDGPMFMHGDRPHPIRYHQYRLSAPSAALWG
jgi:L-alanine-DL-glutamate epimerase-like enolase superfamily enzyme